LPGCQRFGRITDHAGSVIWSDDNSPVMVEGFDHFALG
jgi:thiamine-monophosphate kinase